MQCVVADISWFQSNNKCLQACVSSRTQNIPNLLVITCFIRQIWYSLSPLFSPFRHHFILSAVLFAQRTDCSSCLFFQSQRRQTWNTSADTFARRARATESDRKKAMLIIFAFCFVVIHFLDVEKKVEKNLFTIHLAKTYVWFENMRKNHVSLLFFLSIHSWNE